MTFPATGNTFTNWREIPRRATPTPTFTPIAPRNSMIVLRLNFFPLIIAIVPIIDTCRPVITGRSAIGTGVAPINPVTVKIGRASRRESGGRTRGARPVKEQRATWGAAQPPELAEQLDSAVRPAA